MSGFGTMNDAPADALAIAAARLVVEEGLEYAAAKRKAARQWAQAAGRGARTPELPRNEVIEDEVRNHLALFHADTQPAELLALRRLAAHWLTRLAAHRPHLGGAAWRGTATRLSSLFIDLYCDDVKSTEIDLLNLGVRFDSSDAGGEDTPVLSFAARVVGWREPVTVHLLLHDHDDLRGALKPDARGSSWRGNLSALERLLAAGDH